MTPKEVKEIAAARRTRELRERIARERAVERRERCDEPLDMSVRGNARIAVTALGRTGKPSRSAVAIALRKAVR